MSLNTLFKYYACRCRSTCGSHSKGIWAALPVTARSGANAPTSSIRAVQMHQRWWRSGILHLDQCMWVVRCCCCCCTIAKRRYVRRRANFIYDIGGRATAPALCLTSPRLPGAQTAPAARAPLFLAPLRSMPESCASNRPRRCWLRHDTTSECVSDDVCVCGPVS